MHPVDGYSLIQNIFRGNDAFESSIRSLIEALRVNYPTIDWARTAACDFSADFLKMRCWLENVLRAEKPPSNVVTFWFGLYQAVDDDYVLYISGIGEKGWEAGACYWPENRYANSNCLTQLFRVALTDPPNACDVEYILMLGYAAFLVRALCSSVDVKLLLGESNSREIVLAFDSGDSFTVGRITAEGFKIS